MQSGSSCTGECHGVEPGDNISTQSIPPVCWYKAGRIRSPAINPTIQWQILVTKTQIKEEMDQDKICYPELHYKQAHRGVKACVQFHSGKNVIRDIKQVAAIRVRLFPPCSLLSFLGFTTGHELFLSWTPAFPFSLAQLYRLFFCPKVSLISQNTVSFSQRALEAAPRQTEPASFPDWRTFSVSQLFAPQPNYPWLSPFIYWISLLPTMGAQIWELIRVVFMQIQPGQEHLFFQTGTHTLWQFDV